MANRKSSSSVLTSERPHVEIVESTEGVNLPAVVPDVIVSAGKIPGEIKDVSFKGKLTITAVFAMIGIKNLENCELQRNGQEASPNDYVEPGDTVLAIAKIRGN